MPSVKIISKFSTEHGGNHRLDQNYVNDFTVLAPQRMRGAFGKSGTFIKFKAGAKFLLRRVVYSNYMIDENCVCVDGEFRRSFKLKDGKYVDFSEASFFDFLSPMLIFRSLSFGQRVNVIIMLVGVILGSFVGGFFGVFLGRAFASSV